MAQSWPWDSQIAVKKTNKKKQTAEATGDLIGNKIADKITSVSKKSSTKLCSQNNEANDGSETPNESYISPEKDIKLLMN